MEQQEDRDLRKRMKELTDVPFRPELKARILEEARLDHHSGYHSIHRRRHWRWERYLAVASGFIIACLVGTAAVEQAKHGKSTQETSSQVASGTVTFNEQAASFGLQKAPVEIGNLRVGTTGTDPKGSDVLADLKNTSQKPLHKSDLFGVLAFTPAGSTKMPENWLTFVNGPDETIQPGQTVVWSFHPVGSVLHTPMGTLLVEKPHLKLYSAELTQVDRADEVWTRAPLIVTNLQEEPRTVVGGRQPVQIDTSVTNPTHQTVDLASTRALIWFTSSPGQSFLSDTSIRFMYHVIPEYSDKLKRSTINPGQTVQVNFRVLSDAKSNFFSRTAHVLIINTPDSIRSMN